MSQHVIDFLQKVWKVKSIEKVSDTVPEKLLSDGTDERATKQLLEIIAASLKNKKMKDDVQYFRILDARQIMQMNLKKEICCENPSNCYGIHSQALKQLEYGLIERVFRLQLKFNRVCTDFTWCLSENPTEALLRQAQDERIGENNLNLRSC